MATTQDFRQGDHGTGAKVSGQMPGVVWMLRTIDAAVDNIASGDTVQLFHIPQGSKVLDFLMNVETLEGGTLTIDVGTYTHSTDAAIDADGFVDGLDANSATGVQRITRGILMSDSDLPTGKDGGGWTAQDVAADISALYNNAADVSKITYAALVTTLPF